MVAPQDERLTTNKRTDHQQSGQRPGDWIAPGIEAGHCHGSPQACHFLNIS